ncbi:MAG: CoA transferase [Acidimicrobiales bacterium]
MTGATPDDAAPLPPQPLAGLRVVELATGVAGPYAAKLLADFGADVVKVEPPGGDPARREGARPGPRPDPERSPLFLHLNANKRSVVADLATAEGADLVRALAARADLLIESHTPGALDALGLGPAALREVNPRLVVASVTRHGQTGPYAGLAGNDLTAYALGGPMLATGDPDREPMKLAGRIVEYHCGAVGALSALAAVTMAEASGRGTHVDVSNVETQAASIDRRAAMFVGWQFDGRIGYRAGGGRMGAIPAGIYPTGDGYCQIVFTPNWMPRVADLLGDEDLIRTVSKPDWFDDDDFPEQLNAAIFGWTMQRTKQETMEDAQRERLAITPVNSTTDVLDDKHFRHRDFWQRWDHPVAGTYEAPGPQVRLANGWRARRPAPLLGQHTAEVVAELADRVAAAPAAAAAHGSDPRRLPLAGIRVIDLTVVWAGPLTTTLLADLGAEVIRLDNPNLFPTATRGAVPRPRPGHEADLGQLWGRFPGGRAGERPWNQPAAFVSHARTKLSMTVDLRTELGRETFLELVDRSDLVVENNSIRVLPSLGLSWDVLHERNPELVMLRLPLLGLDGPYAGYVGFGAHMEALCGYSSLRGYPDLDPTSLDPTYYMDPATGVVGAFAALAALRRRAVTGVGELVEVAQAENLLQYIGEYLIDASMTGQPHECHGNRHPHRAPQGVYRCSGDDAWVALSVADDAQWAALVAELGRPAWAAEAALTTEDGRRERHDDLDRELEGWTSGRPVGEVLSACHRAGVAAAPVLDEPGLAADPHLAARRYFRPNSSDDVPEVLFPGHQWRWDGPPMAWGPINMMGRDNDYVYRTVLGKDDAAMAALDAEGHLADGYRDAERRPL